MDGKRICKDLKADKIRAIKIRRSMPEDTIYLVLDAFLKNRSCKTLDLSGLRLGKHSCMAVSRLIRRNHTLKTLKINNSFLENLDLEVLLSFEENSGIEVLEMNGCRLEDVSLRVLARAIQRNQTSKLKEIKLKDNRFTKDGVFKFAFSMQKVCMQHKRVIEVDLHCPHIQSSCTLPKFYKTEGQIIIEKVDHVVSITAIPITNSSIPQNLEEPINDDVDPFFGCFREEFEDFDLDEATWEHLDDPFSYNFQEDFVIITPSEEINA